MAKLTPEQEKQKAEYLKEVRAQVKHASDMSRRANAELNRIKNQRT